MSLSLFLALLLFAFSTSVTPGPNNVMVLTSVVNFGVRATIPHMSGIGIGFSLMVFLVGIGLGQLFELLPWLHTVLHVGGVIYLLWLAWKIAGSSSRVADKTISKPITFLQAALFQWVNPKAWIMALGATATYGIVGQPILSAAIVAGAFALVSAPCNGIWVYAGATLRHVLQNPKSLRIFNIGMALLLVISLLPLLNI